jgi:uncharacterized protein DUF6526
MNQQNYSNHVRSYAAHHFVFYPIAICLLGVATWRAFTDDAHRAIWWIITAAIFMCAFLSFMTRQHYALILQNRLVRLEMRLRYFELAGKRFELIEEQLGFSRIAALRFASDSEFLALVERTLKENLPADEIKRSIKQWKADHMRV